MKKILFILGTRPEAIKLSPLIKYFKSHAEFEIRICNTAQHRELLDEVLLFFNILPDYDLNVMVDHQSLSEVLARTIAGIDDILKTFQPQLVFVQGDTTTAFSGALAAFYQKIKIVHVEAGLRSLNKFSPYPEEINRTFISKIADYHFAPTEKSLLALKAEGITENVWNVGNTVIDALLLGQKIIETNHNSISSDFKFLNPSFKQILITCHRRENFGEPLKEICKVAKTLIEKYNNIEIIYPIHPNPNVRKIVEQQLNGLQRVHLIKPLSYAHLIYLMKKSYLILTDSGGIQEEAPTFGKPVIVLRNVTERMEGIESGNAILGGNLFKSIWPEVSKILNDDNLYKKMSEANNPYGDGRSSAKIYDIIRAKEFPN